MLIVSVLKRKGCIVSSDIPVKVTAGQLFQVYRMDGNSTVVVATGAVRKMMDAQKFKLNPQEGQAFAGVQVGDLVQAVG